MSNAHVTVNVFMQLLHVTEMGMIIPALEYLLLL